MKRLNQVILILTFMPFCWLAMQAVHELGHIIASLVTKGDIQKVILHPLVISQTIIGVNPHPLIVVWAGPLVGTFLPLFAFFSVKLLRFPGLYMFRFFAGFCLVSNGIYIAFGPSTGLTDSAVMLNYGCCRIFLLLFGIPAFILGMYLWHKQGKYFGFGTAQGQINKVPAIASTILFFLIVILELIINLD